MAATPEHHPRLPVTATATPAWAGTMTGAPWRSAGHDGPGWTRWQSGLDAQLLSRTAAALLNADNATGLGAPDGDALIVAFINYHCRASRQLCANLDLLLQRDDRVRLLLRQLPGAASAEAAQLMLGVPPGSTAARVHRHLASLPLRDSAALQATESRFGLLPPVLGQANDALADSRALAAALGITAAPAVLVGPRLWRGAAGLAALEDALREQRRARGRVLPPWQQRWGGATTGC